MAPRAKAQQQPRAIPSHNLPPEIVSLILHHVSTDNHFAPATRQSLALHCATSLVARCWRIPSQQSLWQHLTIRVDSDEPAGLYFCPALGNFPTESLLLEQVDAEDSRGEYEILAAVIAQLKGLEKLCVSAIVNLNSDLFHIPSLGCLRSLTILHDSTFTAPDPTLLPISFRLASLHVWEAGKRRLPSALNRFSILSQIIETSLLSLLDIQINIGTNNNYLKLNPKLFDLHTLQLPWRKLDLRHFFFDFRPLVARCTKLTQLAFDKGDLVVIHSWLSVLPSRLHVFKVYHVEVDGDRVLRTTLGSTTNAFNPVLNSIYNLLDLPALEEVKLFSMGISFINVSHNGRIEANRMAKSLDSPLRKEFMERGILLDLYYR